VYGRFVDISLKTWTTQQGISAADAARQLVRELRDAATLRARVETEIEARQARVREAQRLAQE
jgi:cell fate regulator YaaT (PSP1 superfamily)